MKKLFAVITSLVLAAGMVSCGLSENSSNVSTPDSSVADTQSSSDDTQSEPDDTQESVPDGSDKDSSDDDSRVEHDYTQLPDDYDHSFDYTLLDEDGERIFVSEDDLESDIVERVYALLFAAADNDWDKYLEIIDLETYTAAVLGGDRSSFDDDFFNAQCDTEKENQLNSFNEISHYLDGELSGRIRQIMLEKSGYLSTDNCDVYYLSFVAPSKNNNLNIQAIVYDNGGVWSIGLELWSIVDHVYYDFEELILKQMNAASSGDLDTYMECADPDMCADVIAILLSDDGDIPDDIGDIKELQDALCAISYEDLNEALGSDFEGRILQVQQFYEYEDYQGDYVNIYGRIVMTVRNSDGEYMEVEGYCYNIGERMGVWLQPD